MPCMGPGESSHEYVNKVADELIEVIRKGLQGPTFLKMPELMGEKDHPDEHHSRALAAFHLGIKEILDQDLIEGF